MFLWSTLNDIVIFQSFNNILQSGDKYEFLEKDRDESPEKEKKDNFPERFDKYDDHQRSVQSNGSSTSRSHPQTPSLGPTLKPPTPSNPVTQSRDFNSHGTFTDAVKIFGDIPH